MIVRRFADRLELITQPDHARLAARVMERCVSLEHEPRRDAILRGIAGHDDGWLEEDAAPLVDAPRIGIARHVPARAAARLDPAAALQE